MNKRLLLTAVLCTVACGGEEMPIGMFGHAGALYGALIDALAPGAEQAVVKVQVAPEYQEPFIVTLVPPQATQSRGEDRGITPEELANVFAKVVWGGPVFATAFVDIGSGVCFNMQGNSIEVTIINANPTGGPTARKVGAFVNRGNNCDAQPQRTIVGMKDGQPIAIGNVLAPTEVTDEVRIPPFSRDVQVSILGTGFAAGATYFVTFINVNNVAVSIVSVPATEVGTLRIPSDAQRLVLGNQTGQLLSGVRFVFDLNLP